MIVKQLISIRQCILFRNMTERRNRFLSLLKVIVINGGNNKELRKSIIQPKLFVPVGKQITFLTNTFHTSQRTVPVIIKFFVHSRPLTDFHQSDVGNQQFEFIFSQFIYFLMQRFRPVKVHSHKSTEPQVVGCFRFPLTVHANFFVRLRCSLAGRIQISIPVHISP